MKSATQNVMTLLCDADLTMTVDYVPNALIRHFNHDVKEFWRENQERYMMIRDSLQDESGFPEELRLPEVMHRAGPCYELTYAYTILDHIHRGCPTDGKKWDGLSRKLLRELGKEIGFFPGLPEAIQEEKEHVRERWKKYDITLEVYIISTAIFDMLAGSRIAPYVDGIFACEFYPAPGDDPVNGTIDRVVFPVTYTEKTRFVHNIHKGLDVDVNAKIPPQFRRIPGAYITAVFDGFSDIPFGSTVNNLGGRSIGVYSTQAPADKDPFKQAYKLRDQDRVFAIAPADYRDGTLLRNLLRAREEEIAEQIIRSREEAIRKATSMPPMPEFGPDLKKPD
ncbi:MAG: hypothetical protein KJ574_02215 [Nanoarchaeota archaeon]|nr:hypothetical protein [Nanoarchaeota archaeon]